MNHTTVTPVQGTTFDHIEKLAQEQDIHYYRTGKYIMLGTPGRRYVIYRSDLSTTSPAYVDWVLEYLGQ